MCHDVYSKWYDNLVEKYGEPDEDSTGIIKYVDQDTINYSGNAMSLELGYIELNYKWTTDKTRIFLGAWSENYETTVMISYEDVNHEVEDDHLFGF